MPEVGLLPEVTGMIAPVTGSKLSTWKPDVTLAVTLLVGSALTILVAEADH
ncbi:MAG: hypothetical protein WDO24_02040 [Pseudomonadota bacterium]